MEVDRTPRLDAASDPLGQAAGRVDLPDAPIFFIQNYDVWRFAAGRARPVTTTTELETALAVSPDGGTLAVCRAPADAEPGHYHTAFVPVYGLWTLTVAISVN